MKFSQLLRKISKSFQRGRREKYLYLTLSLILIIPISVFLLKDEQENLLPFEFRQSQDEGDSLYSATSKSVELAFGSKSSQGTHLVSFKAYPEVTDHLQENPADNVSQTYKDSLQKRSIKQKVTDLFKNLFQEEQKSGIAFSLKNASVTAPEKIKDGIKQALLQSIPKENRKEAEQDIERMLSKQEISGIGYELFEKNENEEILIHRDILIGVDLMYSLKEDNGLKEEIRIRRTDSMKPDCFKKALEKKKPLYQSCNIPQNSFTFEFTLDPNVEIRSTVTGTKENPSSVYYLTDTYGRYIGHFEGLFAIDANNARTNNITLTIDTNLLTITVDPKWLYDEIRKFPITIDPSIVHDTQAEFLLGTENRIEVTSDPKVQLTYHELPADEHTMGLWHMNETSNNTCSGSLDMCDSSESGLHGTESSTSIDTTNQKLGAAARDITGATAYISIPDNDKVDYAYNHNFTVSFWVKNGSGNAVQDAIVEKWSGSGGYPYVFRYSSTDKVLFYRYDGTNNPSVETILVINDGVWHHIAGVKEGDLMHIYLDGEWQDSVADSTTGTTTNSSVIYLGRRGSSEIYYWNGYVDELRISNVARTPEEIKAEAEHKPYGVYTSESIDLGASLTSIDDLQWTEYGVATGDYSTANGSRDAGEVLTSSSNLEAHWKFNETSGTNATDSSGNGHTGILTGFSTCSNSQDNCKNSGWTANNKKWGVGALNFDGSGDYVSVASPNLPTGDFTYEAWVFLHDNTDETVFGALNSGVGNEIQLYIASASDNLRLLVDNTLVVNASYDMPVGQWLYLAATRDGSDVTLYVNGQVVDTGSNSATLDFSTCAFLIGVDADSSCTATLGNYLNGVIDTLRVYARALPAYEILNNYQTGQIEFQTRTSADDSTWEAWSPTTSESQLSSIDTDMDNWELQVDQVPGIPITTHDVNPTAPTAPTGCTSHKIVRVNNTGNSADFTNYQIELEVDYESGMSTDFSNLRFTNSSGTDIYYWIESYTSSDEALVLVEVNSIPGNASVDIYMWYNSCTGGNSSDGDNTFLFFDDFGSGFDTDKWERNRDASGGGCGAFVSSGVLYVYAGDGSCPGYARSLVNMDNAIVVKQYMKTDRVNDYELAGFYVTDSSFNWFTGVRYNYYTSNDATCYYTNRDSFIPMPCVVSEKLTPYWKDTWFYQTMKTIGSSTWTYYKRDDGTTIQEATYTGYTPNATSGSTRIRYAPWAWFNNPNSKIMVDWVYARKYADPEPTVEVIATDKRPYVEGSGSMRIEVGQPSIDVDTVAMLHLDETNGDGGGDDVFDTTVNDNDGELNGTSVVDGINGKARSFNGTSDNIEIAYDSTLDFGSNNFSIELWFKGSSFHGSSNGSFIEVADAVGDFWPLISIRGNSTGTLTIYIRDDDADSVSGTTSGTYDDESWHHAALVRNETDGYLYIDGEQVLSGSDSGLDNTSTGSAWYIGKTYDAITRYVGASIDEVRISYRALSREEVVEAYRLGRNTQFTRTISSTDLTTKTKLPLWIASDRPGTFIEVLLGEAAHGLQETDANTVALWHFEEETGSSDYLKDSSGDDNNGTPSGASFTLGKIGKAREFNGTSEYIDVGNETNFDFERTDPFSIEGWISKNGTDSEVLFSKMYASPWTGYELLTATNEVRLQIINTWTSNAIACDTPAGSYPSDGTWFHVAATYNGNESSSGVNIYINGVNQVLGCPYTSVSATILNDYDPRIGARASATPSLYFDGKIDELRISDSVRTADEIRQAYEIGRRTHPVTIDFAAKLDSGNLITGSGDTSFTIDATEYGFEDKGDNLYIGDTVIVRENYDGTEYIAQGTVTAVTASTGAVTVASWDTNSTFHGSGYTANASVFKWQREYFDIRDSLSTHRNATTRVTLRLTNSHEGKTIWIDDVKSAGPYLTDPTATSNVTSTDQRYVQYRALFNAYDMNVTPYLSSVTLNYSEGPSNDLLMRHGKWFSSGTEQGFWWAQ